ncbi:MAG: hypothetical protein WKF28_04510 [Rubrobacteraceae bacterium]
MVPEAGHAEVLSGREMEVARVNVPPGPPWGWRRVSWNLARAALGKVLLAGMGPMRGGVR